MDRRSKEDIVRDLVRLPIAFKARQTVSIHTLLAEAGYPDRHQEISVIDLVKALRDCPDYVPAWIGFSQDKRGGSPWFFRPASGDI